MQTKADYLFEASWEVCNKVGGIYTVVKSKAKLLRKIYKNYFLIGPYIKKNAEFDFSEKNAPKTFKSAFDELAKQGIICHFGIWNIPGDPLTILLEFEGLKNQKDNLKGEYWRDFGVDSLGSAWEFEEPMLWSTAVGMLLEKMPSALGNDKIVGQFHEWLSGFAILYLKTRKSPVKTVFTTHATMLGRAISSSGQQLYRIIDQINPEKEAKRYGIMDKFSTEKACAHNADVFTTVSQITSFEAEKLLGKKADVLLLNGLDTTLFPTFEDISISHKKKREVIREFLAYYFFPYYSFNIENSINFFIVGRFEYTNKGIDVMIEALAQLNEYLKKKKYKKTVNVFFWIPRDVRSTNFLLSDSKAEYIQMREYIEDHSKEIINHIKENFLMCPVEEVAQQSKISSNILSNDFIASLRKMRINFTKHGDPLLTTHNLPNEGNDAILQAFRRFGLTNKKEDLVKVIDYPIYLTGVDGLLDLKYYDAIIGCHLGLFPSYYEPWGYTPLECAALGVPAITTDLSGFGQFIEGQNSKGGIYVLKRMNQERNIVVNELMKMMFNYYKLNQKERVEQKIEAKHLSALADWNIFIENYIEAHNLAMKGPNTEQNQ